MDEVRIKKANAFAFYALYISDNQDLAYFREAVAKREATADIDANKQRHHAVHTLYNYLMGWYIFDHSVVLQNAFRDRFERLGIDLNPSQKTVDYYKRNNFCQISNYPIFEKSIVLVNEFGDVWPIASLLHDIGYILEGNLSSASSKVENERVSNGSKIIHDYFNHWFLQDYDVDFRAANNIAKKLNVDVPDFKSSRSLASLGDHLRDIGSCENIRKELKKDKDSKSYVDKPLIQKEYGLNREAFSIWKEHYKSFGITNMEEILGSVDKVYKDKMWIGANQGKDQGKRNLNHGVCSGLITLQALTFFYELFFGFKDVEWSKFNENQRDNEKPNDSSRNYVSEEMFNEIQKKVNAVPAVLRVRRDNDLPANYWFKKTLWATASAAIHSIVQTVDYKRER
ncbi:MAG: hypothetical protein ACXW1U_14260 [Methylobacter sp.]